MTEMNKKIEEIKEKLRNLGIDPNSSITSKELVEAGIPEDEANLFFAYSV